MVPMWRTCRSPIMAARAASDGIARFTSAEAATSACRVMAPISTALPDTLMPASSRMVPRSMRSEGEERRSFIACTRLWPPARNLPSPFCPASAIASLLLVGRWYWNACMVFLLSSMHGAPHVLRGGGHGNIFYAERVGDRVHHRGRRADGAGFAAAFHAQRIVRAGRLARVYLEQR